MPRPPFSAELLADLHAGVLSPDVAHHVRTAIIDDARAQRILAGLDATTADLQALGDTAVPVPRYVMDRLQPAIDDVTPH